MAKLKAEVTYEHHQRHGASLRGPALRGRRSALGVREPVCAVSNWATKVPGARTQLEKTVGIAADRSLPTFHHESLTWFEGRGPQMSAADAKKKVLLVPDPYTDYTNPAAGKATVRVLEAVGVHVRLPLGVAGSGPARVLKRVHRGDAYHGPRRTSQRSCP